MPKASELKKGEVVEYKGAPHIIKHIDVKSPSSRGAVTLYKIRMNHIKTRQKIDLSLKGDELLPAVNFERRKMTYSYHDGQSLVFMDDEDYSQHLLGEEDLGDDRLYLVDNLDAIIGLFVEDGLIGIELPQSVVMAIADTTPGIKGASASARTKPATFATGLVIQVPEYLEPGELVKINTEDGRFMSRA